MLAFFAVSDQLQIYDGHSDFINNLMTNSNFSHYGMPIDSTDTSATVSSWYLHDFDILSLTHSESSLEFVCSCYDLKFRPSHGSYIERFQSGLYGLPGGKHCVCCLL